MDLLAREKAERQQRRTRMLENLYSTPFKGLQQILTCTISLTGPDTKKPEEQPKEKVAKMAIWPAQPAAPPRAPLQGGRTQKDLQRFISSVRQREIRALADKLEGLEALCTVQADWQQADEAYFGADE